MLLILINLSFITNAQRQVRPRPQMQTRSVFRPHRITRPAHRLRLRNRPQNRVNQEIILTDTLPVNKK